MKTEYGLGWRGPTVRPYVIGVTVLDEIVWFSTIVLPQPLNLRVDESFRLGHLNYEIKTS